MIGINDAALLAFTKLRTRRIRTSVTVLISGLLFAGLIAALIVAQGANDSLNSFSKEGLNSRYIVATSPDTPAAALGINNPNVTAQAQQIYAQMINDKKAAAKKLGITYDPSTEVAPTITLPGQSNSTQSHLNLTSPSALQALQNYATDHPTPGMPEFKSNARAFHPTDFYEVETGGVSDGSLTTMQNGQESFVENASNTFSGQDNDPLHSNQIEKADNQLTAPFLLPGQPSKYSDTEVPIILPYSKAMQLLGLPSLHKNASPSQKLMQLQTLYAQAGTITFAACYRNSVSEQQIQTAISQAAEIAKNKGNDQYKKPSRIFGLPAADSCGPAPILSDARSPSEKALANKQDEFNSMFGAIITPIQQKLVFKVVGLTPDQSAGSSTTFGGILQNVVNSSLDGAIIIPSNMLAQMPNSSEISQILFSNNSNPLTFSSTSYYAEFANADDARNFIDNASCTTRSDGTCATKSRPFQLNAYGSNSIAMADLRHKFTHFFELGTLAVIGIAIVIMSGTIGRMVADGRRETAVFRAIGAKRIDTSAIYALYTLYLTALVVLFALLSGVVSARIFDRLYWKGVTAQAQLLFGASDTAREFHFFTFNLKAISLVLAVAIATGLISMILPLLRNVRRNPIKDMRDE